MPLAGSSQPRGHWLTLERVGINMDWSKRNRKSQTGPPGIREQNLRRWLTELMKRNSALRLSEKNQCGERILGCQPSGTKAGDPGYQMRA